MSILIKKVLTIAGSDSSGGAGIQADIKTITAHKMYAMSAITALTAQNTMGVDAIFEVSADFVGKQIDSIFNDIVPDAVKIGMVSSAEIIAVIASKLNEYKARNIVVDPVMVSTSGSRLINEDAMDALINKLMPLSTIVTPNIPEAEVLSGMKIENIDDMKIAAESISKKCGVSVLVKGGHLVCDATDVLYDNGDISIISSRRIDNPNTHGTGCTLSSAIACALAAGNVLNDAVAGAKKYISGALEAGLDIGKGSGPLEHTWCIK